MTIGTSTDTITVPGAPAIPGLRFRHFRGPADYAAMSNVIEVGKVVDNVERVTSVEDLTAQYGHLANCDPFRDMLMVEVDGQVVGYNRIWWGHEANGPWVYSYIGFLMPEWRGRGIGRAALAYLERRMGEIAREAGHPVDSGRFYQTFGSDSETAREALLLGAGYAPVRYGFNMVRPLSEPIDVRPLPPGLEVRPVAPEKYRTVWDAVAEAFRDHWGFVPPEEAEFDQFLAGPDFNPGLWQVAWHTASGRVAGTVLNFVNAKENDAYRRRRGYTETVTVRRPWRRLGLARALLTRSLQMFKDMGMTEAGLGVDAENPNGALRLYESVGFRMVKRQTTYRKPMPS